VGPLSFGGTEPSTHRRSRADRVGQPGRRRRGYARSAFRNATSWNTPGTTVAGSD